MVAFTLGAVLGGIALVVGWVTSTLSNAIVAYVSFVRSLPTVLRELSIMVSVGAIVLALGFLVNAVNGAYTVINAGNPTPLITTCLSMSDDGSSALGVSDTVSSSEECTGVDLLDARAWTVLTGLIFIAKFSVMYNWKYIDAMIPRI